MDDTDVVAAKQNGEHADERGRFGSKEGEELVLRTIAAHAESLLRTARRHSICLDDAHDAYQRGLEIFMRHADRLDPGRAPAWLHTVVKHEAMAVRTSRRQLVAVEDVDLDAQRADRLPTPDEQLLSFDLVARSAEALQRLKPQELRALWLKAQGHSYSDIAEQTGWSYTKVNRCLTEGRRSFLARYAGIESGAECERWAPVISAMVDREATPQQIVEVRPHLRNCPACRGTLRALQESSRPLAVVLPVPLLAVAASGGEVAGNALLRFYEALVGGLHEKAVGSVTKLQAAIEASATTKVAAVAASAAAVAGGYATVERPTRSDRPAKEAISATRVRSERVSAVAPAPFPPAALARARFAGDREPSRKKPAATGASRHVAEEADADRGYRVSTPSADRVPAGGGGGEFAVTSDREFGSGAAPASAVSSSAVEGPPPPSQSPESGSDPPSGSTKDGEFAP